MIGILLTDRRLRAGTWQCEPSESSSERTIEHDRRDRLDEPVELPLEAEEFLSWLVAERGRSANTIAAYRRDLRAYCAWLAARGDDVDDGRHADTGRVRRRAAGRGGGVERGPPAGGDPHAAPLPRHRGRAARRSDGRARGRARPGRAAQAAVASPRWRRCSTRWSATTLWRCAIAPCSSCSTPPVPGSPRRAGCRWATSTSMPAWCGCSARGPRSASCRSDGPPDGRSTSGSRPAAGCCWRRRSGVDATTPRPCSSTSAAVA